MITSCSSPHVNASTKWKQNGLTIAGGNGQGDQLNQLYWPRGIYVDDDNRCIYIVDTENHRIIEWKFDAKIGQVVAGGNGKGNRMDQLNKPRDVIVDKKTDSLIICDRENRRLVRWSRRNGTKGETIIPEIDCYSITVDNNGNLYICNAEKNEVRRWKIGETIGTIVAGGNGKGNKLNQLDNPTYLFVDEDYSIYVSDWDNHRVMKWVKGAKEGIVVAGGQGEGNNVIRLSHPQMVSVDHFGNVYVVDSWNNRVVRWSKGSKEGCVILGGNGKGQQSNQFNGPIGLAFDRQGNLYVVDHWNDRVQKFEINLN
jgi:sugar lactone lactonase YvrE